MLLHRSACNALNPVFERLIRMMLVSGQFAIYLKTNHVAIVVKTSFSGTVTDSRCSV